MKLATRAILAPLLLWVLVLATACDRPLDTLLGRGSSNPVAITIEQIAETGEPGQFTLSGTTSLPNQTPLTVSAVRRISPQPQDSLRDEEPRYAILDRKSAVIRDGRWQAQLSLWEVSPQGYYQENWQMANGYSAESEPASSTVDFWATLEPSALAQAKLDARTDMLNLAQNPLLNFTPDGEPYLKISEPRVVALPSARTTASVGIPDQDSPGWQGRLTLNRPDGGLTEPSPLPFKESDNLPLPEENLLR